MKVVSFKMEVRTEDDRTVAIEYGAECELDLHISQTRELLRGFRSLSPSEAGELCPTGETAIELRLKAINREQVKRADEFAATRFDVQIVESPR